MVLSNVRGLAEATAALAHALLRRSPWLRNQQQVEVLEALGIAEPRIHYEVFGTGAFDT
jgi:hypothetical protein